MGPQDTNPGSLGLNSEQKLCGTCGQAIHIKAEICPKCGVRQEKQVDKTVLLLLTFFLGGIGAHKFYTRRKWQGVLYILLFWTGIPALLALIEFIIYAFTSSERLQEKYQAGGSGVIIACVAAGVVLIFVIATFAAIAIPQFVKFRNIAMISALKTELMNVKTAEENFFLSNGKYTDALDDLRLGNFSPEITISIPYADEVCFQAVGRHSRSDQTLSVDCHGMK